MNIKSNKNMYAIIKYKTFFGLGPWIWSVQWNLNLLFGPVRTESEKGFLDEKWKVCLEQDCFNEVSRRTDCADLFGLTLRDRIKKFPVPVSFTSIAKKYRDMSGQTNGGKYGVFFTFSIAEIPTVRYILCFSHVKFW